MNAPSSTAATCGLDVERDDAVLRCEDLRVEYPVHGEPPVKALRGVSLTLGRGETIGVVGESGSGKTTLARTIVGQIAPTAGQVKHVPVPGERRPLGARISMIFQDPKSSLNPRLSIRAIAADPLVVHGDEGRADRRRRVEGLLSSVGLPEALMGRRARQLSGGQLQRVAIARALALDPDLIVADEPTSALDVSVQAQVINLLKELRTQRRFAMVIVSHDIRVIRALADRVVVMYDGMVVEEGPVEDVYERPRHPYTLTLLASATSVSEATGREVERADHLLSLPRPYGDEPATQSDRCPFVDRCWQAREDCLAKVPTARGDRHAARCVAPLDEAGRAAALGVGTGAPPEAG
jgi:peptide/nickel transport system ATP-binding protein